MSKGIRFTDEFKKDAVEQVVERGYAVREVAVRLGINTKSLYTWKSQFAKSPRVWSEVADQAAEIRRLKRELARVTEERSILKKRPRLRARVSVRYALIEVHRAEFSVRSMCCVLAAHFSGFYAWLKEPFSQRALEDAHQTELIQQAWTDSGKVYGYRKLTDGLRDAGETCSENRVARLVSLQALPRRLVINVAPVALGASLLPLLTTRWTDSSKLKRPMSFGWPSIAPPFTTTPQIWRYCRIFMKILHNLVQTTSHCRLTILAEISSLSAMKLHWTQNDRFRILSFEFCGAAGY